jgi:hypothetical protein
MQEKKEAKKAKKNQYINSLKKLWDRSALCKKWQVLLWTCMPTEKIDFSLFEDVIKCFQKFVLKNAQHGKEGAVMSEAVWKQ